MMNFTGDTQIVGGHDSASHTPDALPVLFSMDIGAFDLSASLRADGYSSAL